RRRAIMQGSASRTGVRRGASAVEPRSPEPARWEFLMPTLTRLTLALAVGIASTSAVADENLVPLSSAAVAAHQAAAEAQAARLVRRADALAAAPAVSAAPKAVAAARPG